MPSLRCLLCGGDETNVEKLHNFPRNLARSKEWQEKLGIKFTGDPLRSSKICNNHFSPDSYIDLNRFRLHRFAVPIPWQTYAGTIETHEVNMEASCSGISSAECKKEIIVSAEITDKCEHFVDKGVHNREELIIKNKESYTNSSDKEVDANHLDKCEFPKCHLVGAREENYLDESIKCEHTDHTYCSKDDKKRPVELGVVDVFEQFTDKEGVHGRKEYIIENEKINQNSLLIEGNSNQSPACFNGEMPPTSIKSDTVYLGIVDTREQFIDEEGVHDREEYIIKNEKTYPIMEGDANQSSASFTKETPQIFVLESNEYPHSTIKYQKCHICDFKTNDEKDLALHTKSIHLDIKKHKCHMCEYASCEKRKLNMHIKSVHLQIKEHKCHLCEYCASRKENLQEHIDTVHLDIKKYECHLCEYRSSRKRNLREHIDTVHVDIKKYECHLCEYRSSRKGNLRVHVDTVHLDIKKHKCNLCQFAASEKRNLDIHIKSVHLQIKEHKCHLCEYCSSRKENLQEHIDTVHLDIKKYDCHLCEYRSSRKGNLRVHVDTVHLDIKKHKCHLCEYATNKKKDLELHIKCVHLNIKEHRCHLCEYSTSAKRNLDEHIKSVHLKIKEHKCHLCDYCTSRKRNYRVHVDTVHLDIKKHKCHLCKFASGEKHKLDMHIKSVHLKIKEHKCHLCEHATSRKKDLESHIKSVHLNIKEVTYVSIPRVQSKILMNI